MRRARSAGHSRVSHHARVRRRRAPTPVTTPDAQNPGHQWPSSSRTASAFWTSQRARAKSFSDRCHPARPGRLHESCRPQRSLRVPGLCALHPGKDLLFAQRIDMHRGSNRWESPHPLSSTCPGTVSPWNLGAFQASSTGRTHILVTRREPYAVRVVRQIPDGRLRSWGRRENTFLPRSPLMRRKLPSLAVNDPSAGDIWTMDLTRRTSRASRSSPARRLFRLVAGRSDHRL